MKTAMIFLGIIAILAIFGLIVIGLTQPTSREQQSQYQGQPPNQQSTPEKKETSSQQDQTNAWTKIKKSIEQNDKIITAFSTAVIAAFTAALVLATVLLFFSSEKVADAAKQSADVAKTALIATQRAFVFVDSFDANVIKNELWVMPQWKNSGTTPANPVTNYVNWKVFDGFIPSDFLYPDFDASGHPLAGKGQSPSFYLGPQATRYAEALRIPISVIEQVRAGKLQLFIWGWAEYRDAFTSFHSSRFCSEVVITDMGQRDDKTTVVARFGFVGPHNTAD